MLNTIVVIGRLTHDPELRYTQSGTAVSNFSVAVDRPQYNKEKEKEVDFIPVVVWRGLAEVVAEHLQKGRLVAIQGRLQIRSYENSDGQKVRVAEIVADDVRFLDYARESAQEEEEEEEPPAREMKGKGQSSSRASAKPKPAPAKRR